VIEIITLPKPTKHRCKKCGTEIVCTGTWGLTITFDLGDKQTFSTGPVCQKCAIDFIKNHVPKMEVVDENAKKAEDHDNGTGSGR
jgi:hypothetical protein